MTEKTIIEDKTAYSFKKIAFNDLRYGEIFETRYGKLFMKIKYYAYTYYAVDMITGEVSSFDTGEEVHPVNCDITYKKILREVSHD